MEHLFTFHGAARRWLLSVAPLAVAALFPTLSYAQDAPQKPVNLQATQENGYVTLTWDRLEQGKADTLLTEGFEQQDLPEGWTVETNNTYDPTYTWFRFPTPDMEANTDEEELNLWRHTGKGSAVVTFDQVGEHEDGSPATQAEWLIMPAKKGARYLNFYTTIAPEVLEYGQYEEFPDHYYVYVSHDGGKNWEAIWDARYDSNGADGWQLVSLYLGDAGQGDPVVAFEAVSDLDDETTGLYFTWAIDDVSLYTEAADAFAAAAQDSTHKGNPLAGIPSFRPFAMTGKKVAHPKRSPYLVQPGATSYTVLYDDEVIANNVKTTSYTDKRDKEAGQHTYGVRAEYGSLSSETAEITVDVAAPLTNAPRNVKVVPTYDEETGKYNVLMTWDAPEGERTPSHYECYANDALFAGWVDPEECSTEQTGVNRGVQYYAVKAVYENPDGESELVGDLVALGTRNTVSNLKATVNEDEGSALLTWDAPKASEYEVDKYRIFRGGKQIAETSETQYADSNIPEGDYEYNVKVVYTDGVVSLPMAVAVDYGEEEGSGLPFEENFNDGLLPANWTIERINESMKKDYMWRFDNWYELPVAGKGFEGNFASMSSDISPMVNMYAALETPAIFAEPKKGEKIFLEFDIDYCKVDKATGQKSEAGLRYSYDQDSWADVCASFDGYYAEDLAEGETCRPQHVSYDVTDCFATGEPVYFAWFYNAKKAHHIAIDNVQIHSVNTDGIRNVEDTLSGTDAPIYNLNGQRMTDNRSRLATGVYIQNGKKVIIK